MLVVPYWQHTNSPLIRSSSDSSVTRRSNPSIDLLKQDLKGWIELWPFTFRCRSSSSPWLTPFIWFSANFFVSSIFSSFFCLIVPSRNLCKWSSVFTSVSVVLSFSSDCALFFCRRLFALIYRNAINVTLHLSMTWSWMSFSSISFVRSSANFSRSSSARTVGVTTPVMTINTLICGLTFRATYPVFYRFQSHWSVAPDLMRFRRRVATHPPLRYSTFLLWKWFHFSATLFITGAIWLTPKKDESKQVKSPFCVITNCTNKTCTGSVMHATISVFFFLFVLFSQTCSISPSFSSSFLSRS